MADAVEIGYRNWRQVEFIECVGFVEFVGYQWRCDKDWWRQVEFVAFVGFIEFVELIKTETRRLVETDRDTVERVEMVRWLDGLIVDG